MREYVALGLFEWMPKLRMRIQGCLEDVRQNSRRYRARKAATPEGAGATPTLASGHVRDFCLSPVAGSIPP